MTAETNTRGKRPEALEKLFVPIDNLPSITPRLIPLFKRVAGDRPIDLLLHLPFSIIDRRISPSISMVKPGGTVTLTVSVLGHLPPNRRGLPYRVRVGDENANIDLVYFNLRGPYLEKILPTGATRIISGRLDSYNGQWQMAHPDLVLPPEQKDQIGTIHPVYRTTAGLSPTQLENAIQDVVRDSPALDEWIDPALKKRKGWPDWQSAMRRVHCPETETDLDPMNPARRRLAYDELLASQLTLALMRENLKRQRGRPLIGNGRLLASALQAVGFSLTAAQEKAFAEIKTDLESEKRMLRLLQGDVGSGKTIVALFTMLQAVEAGGQAALMAPTEILARQHYKTLEPICRKIGVEIGLLLGQGREQNRAPVLNGIALGRIQIVIGTHALLQDSVAFNDLRVAVIDEQHRFGVDNRMDLTAKGKGVDTLLMTATPIPRTLTLTQYGDMDVSRLTEKPPGRKPIDTLVLPLERLEDVLAAVERKIASGARIYWVCPLVEESEVSDYAAAQQRAIFLAARFGADKVGLVHGRLKQTEKTLAMENFSAGTLSILVATTVIEVGVDVPEATVMVIEHAERYGLAQLHQLRGRVGRRGDQSTCLLLYTSNLSKVASERLRIIRESEDGFLLAEEDLRLRGEGDVLGTKQSGLRDFRLVDPAMHRDLVEIADADARVALEIDPELKSDRGKALKTLLYLFERDLAVLYLRSG